MGDADAAKKRRSTALNQFTRNVNSFNKLIASSAPAVTVNPSYEKVIDSWEKLEEAHDAYLEVTDIDVETDKGGFKYMDEPAERHDAVLVSYSNFLKADSEAVRSTEVKRIEENEKLEDERRKRIAKEEKDAEETLRKEEVKRKLDTAVAELDQAVDSFQRMNVGIKGSLEVASEHDLRNEWSKVEDEFNALKVKLIETVGYDDEKKSEDVQKKFAEQAEKVFLESQKFVFEKLKNTSGGAQKSVSTSGGSTKKEAVKLPSFEGSEKSSPFLKFSSWLAEWEKMITDFDPKWHVSLLKQHLDDDAKATIIGCENDYTKAMECLKKFYGNPLKVIACVRNEVMSPREISEGDYDCLISYSQVLERNFTRLENLGLDHEMSNTAAMSSIVKKLPRTVGENWAEHLTGQGDEVLAKPFPTFISWLQSQRAVWQIMSAANASTKLSTGNRRSSTFFGEVEKRCYNCKEVGHVKKDCTKKPKGGGQNGQKNSNKNQPKQLKVKKYRCALHKGEVGKKCFSDTCYDFKRIAGPERVKLLEENGDCIHCLGDHAPADCQQKHRVCGGRKDDRGCTKSHNVHELYCVEAKVFVVGQTYSSDVDGSVSIRSEVILLVMQVRCARRSLVANVFFDLGSMSNFIREAFARMNGFKGTEEHLNVTTLGGVTTDLTVMRYECSLRDVDGKLETFEAYGMETITGCLSKVNASTIKTLFPHLSQREIGVLQRGDDVDVLIGMAHASWHPERVERARGGGDFWIYRGKFGSCLGGRYPGISEGTSKSSDLFHVNHSYHVASSCRENQLASHELEFCPQRVASYFQSSAVVNCIEVVDSSAGLGQVVSAGDLSEVEACVVDSSGVDGVRGSGEATSCFSFEFQCCCCAQSVIIRWCCAFCWRRIQCRCFCH